LAFLHQLWLLHQQPHSALLASVICCCFLARSAFFCACKLRFLYCLCFFQCF
jgi:hypothetical protein